MKLKVMCLLVVLALTGCLEQDIQRSVLYLEADGSVTWRMYMIATNDPEAEPEKAAERVEQLLQELASGQDFCSEALLEMGAFEIETRIVRREQPLEFTVEGRFDDLDPILEVMLEESTINWEMVDTAEGRLLRFAADGPSPKNEKAHFPLELVLPAGRVLKGGVVHPLDPNRIIVQKPADWDGLELIRGFE